MITLSVTESTNQLISGIPEYLIFEASEPCNIYYTLDGTIPTQSSLIAVDKVYLPTSGSSVVVKAKAFGVVNQSSILILEYKTETVNLGGPRLTGREGISVLRVGEAVVDNLSFDENGNPVQQTSIQFDELQMKASTRNSIGVVLDPYASSLDFINFPSYSPPYDLVSVSSVNDANTWDPKAKVIIIDGSTLENKEKQVVNIVNRPYGNMVPTTKFYDERLGQQQPIVTGNYLRSYYNPVTKVYISYYWESLESRWVQSIQSVDIPRRNLFGNPSNHNVFTWINDRAQSLIF